jgi:GTP cyclohydrolase I
VYVGEAGPSARFRWVKAPSSAELTQLTHTIAHRLALYLERQGLLVPDAEHSYLALEGLDEDPMDQADSTYKGPLSQDRNRRSELKPVC